MKRLLVLAALLAALVSTALAAGTNTSTSAKAGPHYKVVSFAIVANATGAGEIPDETTDAGYSACLHQVDVIPGSPAPTEGWDFTLKNSDGVDLLGGLGANMNTTNIVAVSPKTTTGFTCVPFKGALTLAVSGNSVQSAVITIKAWLYHEQGVQ